MTLRDIVVIGTSAGGVDALPRIIGVLPPSFPGAIVVCQHMAETNEPMLVSIIQRQSELPIEWIEQGAKLEPSHVYVAPPGVHAVLVDGHMQLIAGPRENYVRPSIDRLMRSAAARHGPRTIGVLLTGMLDDGVAGMLAIQAAGGFTIVQDPVAAAYPDLPRRALQAFRPDRVHTVDEMAGALVEATTVVAEPQPIPELVVAEAALDLVPQNAPEQLAMLGPQTSISCPDCGGPLWDVGTPQFRRYRCYLGHVASADRVLRTSNSKIEGAMWSAIRALHERVTTYDALAADSLRTGSEAAHRIFAEKASDARDQVELARSFMAGLASRS